MNSIDKRSDRITSTSEVFEFRCGGVVPKLHVVEKMNLVHPVTGTTDEWESGFWNVDEWKAHQLVGGDMFLHKHQKDPSHFGGKILSFRVQQDGEYQGRIIFRIKFSRAHKNVKTPPNGWSYEMKIVWDTDLQF